MAVRPGDLIGGKYRVESVLGQGGMAVVVAARHEDLDELVAIKILLPHRAENEDVRARFAREARAAAKIKSEHVARVTDVGALADGTPYMVMEHLEGEDFATLLDRRKTLPATEATLYLLQVCDALREAHSLGIVHRDVKPANLFLAKNRGRPPSLKVLDFGISKIEMNDRRHTETKEILGSPWYMAPEQMQSAKTADGRSDIWSLGVILYELVTGDVPFDGETMTEVIVKVLHDEPPLDSVAAALGPRLLPIVRRCLAKNPDDRYASIDELASALRSLERTVDVRSSRPSRPPATRSSNPPAQRDSAPPAVRDSAPPSGEIRSVDADDADVEIVDPGELLPTPLPAPVAKAVAAAAAGRLTPTPASTRARMNSAETSAMPTPPAGFAPPRPSTPVAATPAPSTVPRPSAAPTVAPAPSGGAKPATSTPEPKPSAAPTMPALPTAAALAASSAPPSLPITPPPLPAATAASSAPPVIPTPPPAATASKTASEPPKPKTPSSPEPPSAVVVDARTTPTERPPRPSQHSTTDAKRNDRMPLFVAAAIIPLAIVAAIAFSRSKAPESSAATTSDTTTLPPDKPDKPTQPVLTTTPVVATAAGDTAPLPTIVSAVPDSPRPQVTPPRSAAAPVTPPAPAPAPDPAPKPRTPSPPPAAAPPPAAPAAASADDATIGFTVARKNQAGVRECWENSGKTTSLVTVTVGVDANGGVTSAAAPSPDPNLTKCLEGKLHAWTFPAGAAGRTFRIPVRLNR